MHLNCKEKEAAENDQREAALRDLEVNSVFFCKVVFSEFEFQLPQIVYPYSTNTGIYACLIC